VPAELSGIIEAILGLDNRRRHGPIFGFGRRRRAPRCPTRRCSWRRPMASERHGARQCVAIIELGGGFRPADLQAYFAGLGVATPSVVAVSVDHGTNSPTGDANGPDGEVMLDIEVVGAIAPETKIVVYFRPTPMQVFERHHHRDSRYDA